MTTSATSSTKRMVACHDGLNRPRHLTTYRADDRVVLLAPPTEAALLTPARARELARALAEQADVVESAMPPQGQRSRPFPLP